MDILDSVIELLDQNGTRLQNCGHPAYTSTRLNDNIDATTLDSALDLKVPGAIGTQNIFYLHVFDWRGDARPDMQYYLNISGVNEPLKITTNLGTGATRGISYQQQMATTGGTGSITWSVASAHYRNLRPPSAYFLQPGKAKGIAVLKFAHERGVGFLGHIHLQ